MQHLITAAGLLVCRHGVLLRLINFFSGERHAYSTLAALSLLEAGTSVRFWWYDIACRWGKSYQKWLAEQPQHIREKGAGMQFLIPPWHCYAHRESHLERVSRLYANDVVLGLPFRACNSVLPTLAQQRIGGSPPWRADWRREDL
ncbi:hypothetical protein GPECTOR_961g227 [Gonium pectorale]|uniref:Uncharacterized protein n=1 Tax=Gonium pectorale TaxID=33097 RepID=A0A150FTS7_GONPE|nr:hypothetical protein GPECTOR_961g227 [Gonium pectorale]|eukprot:KXZ41023.1 hypothetical protein GPECTOR_961g227 [Gonium pectorale]